MRIHDVIGDVTRSQSGSNFEINISPSIFELERRSKAKKSEMRMAIFLVYSTSGITSGKKLCPELKMATIFLILKYQTQLQFDIRYEKKNILNYAKKNFHGDDIIDDVTGWPQSFPLYSYLGEVGSCSKLQRQCLINKCKYHNRLSRLYMPKDDLNE